MYICKQQVLTIDFVEPDINDLIVKKSLCLAELNLHIPLRNVGQTDDRTLKESASMSSAHKNCSQNVQEAFMSILLALVGVS